MLSHFWTSDSSWCATDSVLLTHENKEKTKGGRRDLLVSFARLVVVDTVLFLFKAPLHCLAALSIVHVRSFFEGKYYWLKEFVSSCCFLCSLTFPLLSECFQQSCHFCRGQFPVMYSFPLRVYERHGACLCPEMLGSSVLWWVYIFKNNPHSSDYEHNSDLKFLLLMMIIYIYFFQFSSALFWKPFCFLVGFHFYGYAVCVLHVVLKHFRENKRSLPWWYTVFFFFFSCFIPTVFSSWYPLGLTPPPVKVAVIESRHGTTHCLNTVDHSRWSSQETHPVEKEWAAP